MFVIALDQRSCFRCIWESQIRNQDTHRGATALEHVHRGDLEVVGPELDSTAGEPDLEDGLTGNLIEQTPSSNIVPRLFVESVGFQVGNKGTEVTAPCHTKQREWLQHCTWEDGRIQGRSNQRRQA